MWDSFPYLSMWLLFNHGSDSLSGWTLLTWSPPQLVSSLLVWPGSHHYFFPDSAVGEQTPSDGNPHGQTVSWLLMNLVETYLLFLRLPLCFRPAVCQMSALPLSPCYILFLLPWDSLSLLHPYPTVWFAVAHLLASVLEKDSGKYILETFCILKTVFNPHTVGIWFGVLCCNFSGSCWRYYLSCAFAFAVGFLFLFVSTVFFLDILRQMFFMFSNFIAPIMSSV